MRAAPRPANISTNEDADCEKNFAPDSWATALASSVLPVPGGPCSSTPLGTLAPSSRERLGVAQEVDDLLELALGLVDAGDVVPADLGLASGLISTGLVRGIVFSVRQSTKTSAAMKRIPRKPLHSVPKSLMRSAMLGPGIAATATGDFEAAKQGAAIVAGRDDVTHANRR